MAGQTSSSPLDWEREIAASPLVDSGKSSAGAKEDAPPSGTDIDKVVEQHIEDSKHNRTLRERYADKAHQLAAGCISGWMVMLGCQGVIKAATGVEMWSDKVIIAATTGVTVSVLAAFLGVIRGLFPNGDKK